MLSKTPQKLGDCGGESVRGFKADQTPATAKDSTAMKRQNSSYSKRNDFIGESKPSSVTTACTYAPNEMSATKSVTSSKYQNSTLKKKRSGTETVINITQNEKQKKKTQSQKGLVGTKRHAEADPSKYHRMY